MARPDNPFVDLPAGMLTVRLEILPTGTVGLSVYYGGDPAHTLGTDDVFRWTGRWTNRSGVRINGRPLDGVDDEEIVEFVRSKLMWHDLSDQTIDAFWDSGALQAALRDVGLHHLAMTVMSS